MDELLRFAHEEQGQARAPIPMRLALFPNGRLLVIADQANLQVADLRCDIEKQADAFHLVYDCTASTYRPVVPFRRDEMQKLPRTTHRGMIMNTRWS